MASTSLSTGLHGTVSQSMLNTQSELKCGKRRRLHVIWSTSHYRRHILHQGCSWQAHKKERMGHARALSEEDQFPKDDERDGKNFTDADGKAFREKLENIIGDGDANFSGKDLAMLIRNKYGRSYDVQLIKKEFMGRQLLAMNVMWKYREQRSFPLTEEEYLLHLDDVANNLKCWGAVSYVRNSLAKTKERPRIGKAVSIFIDLDETGGRAKEWIYR